MRPGTTIGRSSPATTASRSNPASNAVAAAASAFTTLNDPTNPVRIGTGSPSHAVSSNDVPSARSSTPRALTSASGSPTANRMTVSPASAACRARRAPYSSATCTAAWRVNSGVNRRALASKYASSEPW